ncbi:MAG: FAD-dependent oxidoreductase [Candidatus Symbiothrix sp.]|jgi:hypothetical protein|nr:FAD-dependent oxidoreductase [Candidatus Symbiothrix sp.]
MIGRRNFLKAAGIGVAAGLVSPELALGKTPIVQSAIDKKKSTYEDLYFDVAVVGAGPGGIPAAVAAAREGAKVVLIEEDWAPGGAPVDMFVTFVCGSPRVGIFREMIQQLNAKHDLDGLPDPSFGEAGYNGMTHFWHPTSFIQVIQKMIEAESNLSLMCGAPVVDTIVEKKKGNIEVKGVQVMRNAMLQNIYAKVTIDATGTGLVSAAAGCEFMYGNESKSDFNESVGLEVGDGKVQPCTWMFIAQKIKRDAVFPLDKLKGSSGLADGEKDWLKKDRLEEIHTADKGIYLFWGTTVKCKKTYDNSEVAAAQMLGLKQLEHNIRIINEAGFSVNLAPKIGVRECRRIKGDYVITADDIINGVMPDDKVADAHYSLDAWGMQIPESVKHGPPYGIPYRALTPLKTEGLLTAGRIISGTKIAHSSYRVQPICAVIGEAAGTAAAMAAIQNKRTRDIDLKDLQARLDAKGLFDYTKNRKKK